MSRIKPLTKDQADETTHRFFDATERVFGQPSVPVGLQAYCPPILEASRALGAAPARSATLPDEIRSLVCVRVAQIVTCPF